MGVVNNVKTEGGSKQLAKHQMGIFDIFKTNKDGATAVKGFEGYPDTAPFEIRVGDTLAYRSTFPFLTKNILSLKASAPQATEKEVDTVIMGYNGIDDKTALNFRVGDTKRAYLRLSGGAIGLLGYKEGFVDTEFSFEAKRCPTTQRGAKCEECDECEKLNALPIVVEGVERLLKTPLLGGAKIEDFVKVSIIKSCTGGDTLTTLEKDYKFWSLKVADSGTADALGLVQAQYPKLDVKRIDRRNGVTTYQTIQPGASPTPEAYKQGLASIIKDCKECPSGYSEVKGGHLYAVSLKDDNAGETLEALENAIDTSALKTGYFEDGVYSYTFITSKKLTDEKIGEFLTAQKTKDPIIQYLGEVDPICKNSTVTSVAWVEGETCKAIEQEYVINLPDNKCGENRLEELQARYPHLTIKAEASPKGGCQTQYSTKVIGNIVCKECDDIFKDLYKTEAPAEYDNRNWTLKTPINHGTDCKVGIKFEGKVLEVHPSEEDRDSLGFVDDSVRVQVAGGFNVGEHFLGFNTPVDGNFHVEYKSKRKPRTHLGGNLWMYEDMGRVRTTGQERHKSDFAKMVFGEESGMKSDTQYVDYALTLRRSNYTQGFAGRHEDNVTYHFYAEVGRHEELEKLLNLLVSANGIAPVRALGGGAGI